MEKYYCGGCGEHETMDYLVPELNGDGYTDYTCIICAERAYTAAELSMEESNV